MSKTDQRQRHTWLRVSMVLLVLLGSSLLLTAVFSITNSASAIDIESPQFSTPECVDFEDLTLNTQYQVGDSFVDSGVVIHARDFVAGGGTVITTGHAQVGNAGLAGGAGQELAVNNINLSFDFGQPLTALSFLFGEYGGNLNIEINGDFRNFDNFTDINGLIIGGVELFVINGLGNDTGFVRLDGPVGTFMIGGQELWLDDVCPETDCVDFEDLTPGSTYVVDDAFVDSGILVNVTPFVWSNGTVFTGGVATVDNAGRAGGSGLDINTNNVNLAFQFKYPLKGLSFDFGEYGGNVNIEVNGDFRNVFNFADINGLVVGGVPVVVINGLGNDQGKVFLFGPVFSLAVGGQELWLDNFCPETCCVDFESVPPMASYAVGDDFFDSEAQMTLYPFTWSNGTVFTGGTASVGQAGLAGGTGQEMNLNNINMGFDFGNPVSSLSLLFGEYGGNLNMEVNGIFVNFDNFADIHGATIGGASVSVINGLGSDKGKLMLDGVIFDFRVGGQELWIDDVCAPRMNMKQYLPVIMK